MNTQNTALVALQTERPYLRRALILAASLLVLLAPALSSANALAITPVYPSAGQQLDGLMVNPTVAFDIATGEKPKWVLLGLDPEMTQTVRYCRAFFAAMTSNSTRWHYACNSWATGVDAYGQDIIKPLTSGKTYYWQVVYTDSAGVEQKSAVNTFTIKPWDSTTSSTSGSTLNTGAAAYALSGVRIPYIASRRIHSRLFQINVTYVGAMKRYSGYVIVTGRGVLSGYKKIKLNPVTGQPGKLRAVWYRSAGEAAIPNASYYYQAFVISAKNGAKVRSQKVSIVIR